jgi:hypothetical protein
MTTAKSGSIGRSLGFEWAASSRPGKSASELADYRKVRTQMFTTKYSENTKLALNPKRYGKKEEAHPLDHLQIKWRV